MNVVVLLGPPGSGKGTVAEVFVEKGYYHVSTGDLLREEIRLGTQLGQQASILMSQGAFVPDNIVVGMIRGLLEKTVPGQQYLFDGFPRTLVQAEKLDELIASLGGSLKMVVQLQCPDNVIVERLCGRRTCSECGAVYHTRFNPPKEAGRCNLDGSELIQRADDNEQTIRKRLDVYAGHTAPLIDYYKTRNRVHSIDATQRIDEVHRAALDLLGMLQP